MEARVLQQQHVGVPHCADSFLGSLADAIVREADVALEDMGEFNRNRL